MDQPLDENIIKKTKQIALLEYLEKSPGKDSEHFLAKCYAIGYIKALISEGYEVSITKEG